MPIRISDAATEELIRELAAVRQLSPTQAVRDAVKEALAASRDHSERRGKGISLIKEVVDHRLFLEKLDTADEVASGISDDLLFAFVFFFFASLFGLVFREIRLTVVFAILIGTIVTVVLSQRALTRKSRVRAKYRESVLDQMNKVEAKMPVEFGFLYEFDCARLPVWHLVMPDEEK